VKAVEKWSFGMQLFVCFLCLFGRGGVSLECGKGVTLMGLHGLSCMRGWVSSWVVAGV
jgi:hypothetical protein